MSPTSTPTPTAPAPTSTPTATPGSVILLNGNTFARGAIFEAAFVLRESIRRPFTVYEVIVIPPGTMPDATMLDVRTLSTRLLPLGTYINGLSAPFVFPMKILRIPEGAWVGNYILMMGFFDPNKPITGPNDAFLLVQTPFSITSGREQ